MKINFNILRTLVLIIFLFNLCVSFVHAGPVATENLKRNKGDEQQQLQRNRQISEERNKRQKQKDVLLQTEESRQEESLPQEEPSFLINKIIITGTDASRFKWLQKKVDRYSHRKIGQKGLALINKRLCNLLIDKGYITTKVIIPEQDISKGILYIQIVSGRIGDIRFAPATGRINWKSAFPVRPGDLLNLRDLEQGLEQLQRLASQNVDFQLVPGNKSGFTDVVIQIERMRPDRFFISIDNAGNKATGKLQDAYTYNVDNLTGENDLFSITYSQDSAQNCPQKAVYGKALNWSFPSGYWTYSLNYYANRYRQTIPYADNKFLYSGDSKTWSIKAERLMQRTQRRKTGLAMTLIRNRSYNYIDDTEILVQRKATTALELAINNRRYIKKDIWDYQLAYRKGVPWFGSQDDTGKEQTSRYNLWTAEINWQKPNSLWGVESRYTLTLRGQFTQNRLYASDGFSIGNRYTVRGFDGEETLIGEKGFYLRNEIAVPLKKQNQEIYLALDYGSVSGNSIGDSSEQILLGGALGVRGNKSYLNFDVFAGWPFKKPVSMKSQNPTFGFQCTWKL